MMLFLALKHSVAALCLLVIVALAAVPLTNASIVATNLVWNDNKDQNGIVKIRVCIDNDSSAVDGDHYANPSLDDVVCNVRYALFLGWEQHSSIRFYDWRKCNELTDAERNEAMQVYIHPTAGNYANIGIQSKGAPKGVNFKPWGSSFNKCIYWDFFIDDFSFDCVQQYAIHEFGHALGLQHEWQHPKTTDNCRGFVAGYAPEETKLGPQPFDTIVNPNYYDWDSIMTYDDRCAHVSGVRFGSKWPTLTDRAGLVRTYPKPKVSDIRLVGAPPGLSSEGFYNGVIGTSSNLLCMDIELGSKKAYMFPCHFGMNQLFSFDWKDSTIKSPDSRFQGYCLDGASRNGNVYFGPCHGGANQKWKYDPTRQEIKNVAYNQCLDMNNDKNLILRDCQNYYKWNHKFSQPADDVFELRSPFGSYSRCWDIHPDTKNVYFYTECHGGANQKFRYDKTTKRITSPFAPNLCLDVATDGSYNVYMYPCHDGANQKWNYIDSTGELKNDWATSRCVDIDPTGSNIYMYPCHGGDNQKFVFFGYRP